MGILHSARMMVQRVGLDVTRFPHDGGIDRALLSAGPATVVDVGANDGQFALGLRRRGFTGRIISLEPGSAAFGQLSRTAKDDPRWTCVNAAAGAEAGELTLHIAANGGASSSVLPMLAAHETAAPDATYVAAEQVEVVRLDALVERLGGVPGPVGLKLDVQGYEEQVLEGCGDWFSEVTAVLIELSTVPLYEGGWLWREAADWLHAQGFSLASVDQVFVEPSTGRTLSFDGLFVRDRPASNR